MGRAFVLNRHRITNSCDSNDFNGNQIGTLRMDCGQSRALHVRIQRFNSLLLDTTHRFEMLRSQVTGPQTVGRLSESCLFHTVQHVTGHMLNLQNVRMFIKFIDSRTQKI